MFIAKKIEFIEDIISMECSEENINIVNEHLKNLELENGNFSQSGMWKLKSKLCPTVVDPPTAKLDKNGKLVTNTEDLLNLYLETYSDRLSHRKIKSKYDDIFNLKTQLWQMRLELCSEVKTGKWTQKNLNDVLRSLKKNKTRDPLGLVNEIFKPKVIGEQLERVLLSLLNDIKIENLIAILLQLANISSIWKRKTSKKSLENDRGIFVLCVLRNILDKLL